MAPKSKGTKPQPKAPEVPKEYPTIRDQLEAEYLSSRPYQVLKDTKGLSGMSASEKVAYANYRFLETDAWQTWTDVQQREFWKVVEAQKIPFPLPKPKDLGKDWRGRDIGSYKPEEYRAYQRAQRRLLVLRGSSESFRQRRRLQVREGSHNLTKATEEDIEQERIIRKEIGQLQGKAMGQYEGDPEWDDVVPIPQDDGEGALAAIAYTDEYAEAMGYLRAVMASKEHSPRVLALTEHIINLNAAHYTVWLYRASTIFALSSPISAELDWVNSIALDNQKNYQIWHHRQLLIDHLYPTIASDPEKLKELAESEIEFMGQMFDQDSKNYHVWSYRQYLVRKLNLFNDAELKSIETLLRIDVRNNSAWSHRFFVVFSTPEYTTPSSKATEHDPLIPSAILDREIQFGIAATFEAPQNPSPWNYIRGVLRKGGRKVSSLESFARDFVKIPKEGDGEEEVMSSHALELLADAWEEMGEEGKADKALILLGEKYDPVRKNYWEWKRGLLKEGKMVGT